MADEAKGGPSKLQLYNFIQLFLYLYSIQYIFEATLQLTYVVYHSSSIISLLPTILAFSPIN